MRNMVQRTPPHLVVKIGGTMESLHENGEKLRLVVAHGEIKKSRRQICYLRTARQVRVFGSRI